MSEISDAVLGPLGAVAVLLILFGLFYTGRILSNKTVPRADYDRVMEINKTLTEGLGAMTTALNELVSAVRAAAAERGHR